MKTTITFLFFLVTASVFAADQRPNIVFILADDLGVNDVGAFNPKTFYETPNIDQLAKDGICFTSAYAACNVCSPTRYSIQTGRYPARAGLTNFLAGVRSEKYEPAELQRFMPLEEITIGEAFHEAGYQTALIGKWHLGDVKQYGPQHQGYDVVSGDTRYIAPSIKNLTLPEYPPINRNNTQNLIETKTTRAADDALLTLDAFGKSDQPFLLFLTLYQVHVPLGAAEKYIAPYREKKERLGLQDNPDLDFIGEEQVFVTDEPRKARIRQNHLTYAGMISHMDETVGRVLKKLEELHLNENTIVVFMSDNGGLTTAEGSPTSNLPFRNGKGWNYEGGVREPLIIRWTKTIKSGSVNDTPIISTDFYPTLLEAAEIPLKPKQHLDGISFLTLLKGGKSLPQRPLFWHYPHYSNQGGFPSSSVRFGDWKLIQRLEDGRTHLYNIKDDVGEQNDLADKYTEKVIELQRLLFDWYTETDALFLQPKDGKTPWQPMTDQY
ncbi:MAG: sulfatase [Planctomycetaceae bacterium]|nr:sulfatase [Planctomycetaceae bacterium]